MFNIPSYYLKLIGFIGLVIIAIGLIFLIASWRQRENAPEIVLKEDRDYLVIQYYGPKDKVPDFLDNFVNNSVDIRTKVDRILKEFDTSSSKETTLKLVNQLVEQKIVADQIASIAQNKQIVVQYFFTEFDNEDMASKETNETTLEEENVPFVENETFEKNVVEEIYTTEEPLVEDSILVEETPVEEVQQDEIIYEDELEDDEEIEEPSEEMEGVLDDVFGSKKNYARIPFATRMSNADRELKKMYNEIKSEILSWGVKSRISKSSDTFRLHQKPYVKITVAGKKLKIYFALDPKDYINSTIPVKDVSDKQIYQETPLVFKVSSKLSLKRCKQLITDVMSKDGLEQGDVIESNWAKALHA